MTPARVMELQDQSHVAQARRAVSAVASGTGLSAERCSDAAIVATELSTNLLKHGGGGRLLVQQGAQGGVEMLALDRGPGIANVELAMRDGYSTAGSPGTGLGAIWRLSNLAEMYTRADMGTAVFAAVRAGDPRANRTGSSSQDFELGTVCTAVAGESVSGDAHARDWGPSGLTVLVADGLGHGLVAAEASDAAVDSFERHRAQPVPTLIASIHGSLRSTRGAAVAVARVEPERRVVRYCGVGNIAGAVVGDREVRRMVSHNGTAGMGTPRLVEFTYPWDPGSTLVLHSDGIGTKWDFSAYPGLRSRHPALIAGVIYRDFARGRDDATVVVAREAAS